jgi:hypothetical protein
VALSQTTIPSDKPCNSSSKRGIANFLPFAKLLIYAGFLRRHMVCSPQLREFEKPMWSPENILKGRMGEALINELLYNSGNTVYRFGYEMLLQNLNQSDRESEKE